MNPLARNVNRDGSEDIGLMQINSRWMPLLRRYGITTADLLEPCTSIMIGAWVLGSNFQRMGYNISAIGAYNAADPIKRERYAAQVLRRVKPRLN